MWKLNKIQKIFVILVLTILFILFYFIYQYHNIDIILSKIEDNYSVTVLDENNKILDVFLDNNQQWHIKENEDIGEKIKIAVINYEDKNFYSHMGVDFLAVMRSIKDNCLSKKRFGASTITMQVAKFAQNNSKRTYFNKIKEIFMAFVLEQKLPKEEILKLYLNNAPYGGNIIGYSTASYLYFNKSPENLSWSEAALLAILPNSPGYINLQNNRKKLLEKRNKLLDKLASKNLIEKSFLELYKKEPIPTPNKSFKKNAPHLSRRMLKLNQKVVKTTINIDLQQKINKICENYSKYVERFGIDNLAVLIVENSTNNVKAYVGSQDFLDEKNYGQVDGIIAKRSPGSLLKPFLYALSIDKGLICPESKIQDVPTFFSNFNPQNASKKYFGLVSAKQALINSLNIPFVHLLQEYDESQFFYFLKNVTNFPETDFNRYGLSLILGTKEFTMEELAKLYTGLANYGEFSELNYQYKKENIKNNKKKIISDGASYLTLKAMQNLVRPGLQDLYKWKNPISWKTGTSYGQRDGWACGITPEYTFIVWCGNFDGKSSANLSGVITAGNLLFNIFQALNLKNLNFEYPYYDLKEIEIDEKTGYRNVYSNIKSKKTLYPKKAMPLRASPFYKKIYVNAMGQEIDSRSKDFINKKEKIVLSYPIEVVNYFISEGIQNQLPQESLNKKSIKIIYPTKNLKIYLPKDIDKEQNLIFKIANVYNKKIYWYLDNTFIGSDRTLQKEINLSKGSHILSIVTEDGENDKISFYITKNN